MGGGGATGGTTTGVGSGARGLGTLIIPVALASPGAGGAGGITLGIGMKDGGGAADGGVGIAGRCDAGVTPGTGGA